MIRISKLSCSVLPLLLSAAAFLQGCGGAPGARSETEAWEEGCPQAIRLPLELVQKKDGEEEQPLFPKGFSHWKKEDCAQIWILPPIVTKDSVAILLPASLENDHLDFFSFTTEVRTGQADPVFAKGSGVKSWRIDLGPELAAARAQARVQGTVKIRLQLVFARLGRVVKDLTLTILD